MPKANAAPAGIPKGWPPGVAYLRTPSYSKKLKSETMTLLVFAKSDLPANEQALQTNGPSTNVRITPIHLHSHPAKGQHGLFATQHLPADAFILSYVGFVHDQADLDEASDYDLCLEREIGVGVDASKMGNEARFINDYRGVSVGPNAEFRDMYVDIGGGRVEKRVGVFVLGAGKSRKNEKGIAKGEEILVSYGKGFWSQRIAMQ